MTVTMRLKGANALVFGGASGIGAATVERLRSEGATVAVADRQFVQGARRDATRDYLCDIRNSDDIDRTVAAADVDLGGLDIVVNTVGRPADGTALSTTDDEWRVALDINLTGAFRIGRAALRAMAERGSGVVVHVASDAGLVAWPGQVAYSAAKGGLVHLTRAQAVDAAALGVRVNCVCPSFTDTPMFRSWLREQADPDEAFALASAAPPMGRLARPEEVAAAITFLASPEAAQVTGVALPVDGGISAQ